MAIMAEVGPTRLSVSEVARRAGVSRMTVYRRYDGLPAVVSAALTAEFGEVLAAVSLQCRDAPDARRRAVAETVGVVAALLDHTLLQRVLDTDPQSLLPVLIERHGSGQRLLLAHLTTRLAAGMAARDGDGSIRDGDPALLALTVLAMSQQFVIGIRPMLGNHPEPVLLAELSRAIDGYLGGP